MSVWSLVRWPVEASSELLVRFLDVFMPEAKSLERQLRERYPDMDALNEIEGELDAHEPNAPYLSWPAKPLETVVVGQYGMPMPRYCNRCGYPHSTETRCLRDREEMLREVVREFENDEASPVPPTGANPEEVEPALPGTAPSSGTSFRDIASSGGVTQLHRVIDLVNSGASPERVKEWCEKQIAMRTAQK